MYVNLLMYNNAFDICAPVAQLEEQLSPNE